jgi:hypothetical protein
MCQKTGVLLLCPTKTDGRLSTSPEGRARSPMAITVFAQDWQAQGREKLLFNNEVFSADFRGCGDKKWALRQLGK